MVCVRSQSAVPPMSTSLACVAPDPVASNLLSLVEWAEYNFPEVGAYTSAVIFEAVVLRVT